jgi:hypothetical protein
VGLKKFFSRDKDTEDEYREYRLGEIERNFLVDYDLKTWEVRAISNYDYDGYLTREWELHSDSGVGFLEQSVDDGQAEWTFTKRISIDAIAEDVVAEVASSDDPPRQIHFEGKSYEADEMSAGIQTQGDEESEKEFVGWSYESEDGRVLFLNQWGEGDFSAYEGIYVEEYQFTDILPGGSVEE